LSWCSNLEEQLLYRCQLNAVQMFYMSWCSNL
jgi:hypothetical protein